MPIGVRGDLYIGGDGLARGYLNQPQLTATRFISNPFSAESGSQLYRTGDLARYLPDGNIEFLGRLDDQVKIRGFRIELGEIQSTLEQHPAVHQCVAAVREDDGEKQIVAHVARRPGTAPSESELRAHLAGQLPPYMLPTSFVILDEFPLLPSGKVDRRALPAPALGRRSADSSSGAAVGQTQRKLVAIWIDLLHLDDVGIHESFFQVGGHSLRAISLLARIQEVFGVSLPLRRIFQTPTIAGLAEAIDSACLSQAAAPSAIPQTGGEIRAPLSFAQQRLWFLDRLEEHRAVYNVPVAWRLSGPLDPGRLERALDRIVRRHESLRTCFPAEAGVPVQVVREGPASAVHLSIVDLSHLTGDAQRTELARLLAEQAQGPLRSRPRPVAAHHALPPGRAGPRLRHHAAPHRL